MPASQANKPTGVINPNSFTYLTIVVSGHSSFGRTARQQTGRGSSRGSWTTTPLFKIHLISFSSAHWEEVFLLFRHEEPPFDKETKEFYPAIIDNWDKVPIQLLQKNDIGSLKNLYKALTKIFDGKCFVHYILMVKKWFF